VKLSTTVKEAVADAHVEVSQEERAEAGSRASRPRTCQDGWDVVRAAAARAGSDKLAPHDLRRTCARLCHLAGGELDQIQFLLGHVSIQTTERYLGCKQKLRIAVNDRLGIEADAA
jgi:integrase